MLTIEPLPIPGARMIRAPRSRDDRGWFMKPFQRSVLGAAGIELSVAEHYLSSSRRGVIRGMHFQLPPHEHGKLVYCIAGAAFDVVVDLRLGSPTYGQSAAVEITESEPGAIWIPVGCAHGFQALTDGTVLGYLVGSEHAPSSDSGVHWSSVDVDWPLPDEARCSDRDARLPALSEFQSPFRNG